MNKTFLVCAFSVRSDKLYLKVIALEVKSIGLFPINPIKLVYKKFDQIQKYQLIAIEAGSLERLPPGVYIRGFVKKYADFLGCNGSELAFTFPIKES